MRSVLILVCLALAGCGERDQASIEREVLGRVAADDIRRELNDEQYEALARLIESGRVVQTASGELRVGGVKVEGGAK